MIQYEKKYVNHVLFGFTIYDQRLKKWITMVQFWHNLQPMHLNTLEDARDYITYQEETREIKCLYIDKEKADKLKIVFNKLKTQFENDTKTRT